jgi:hypothetical protein
MEDRIANPPVNLSNVNASLSNAQAAYTSLNVSALRTSLLSFNATLWQANATASPGLLSLLNSLDSVLASVRSTLEAGIAALDTFSGTLKCAGLSTTCTASGSNALPCDASHVCTPAQQRCLVDGTTACLADSDCPSLSCMYNGTAFAQMSTALNAYSVAQPGPDVLRSQMSPLASVLGDASGALQSIPSLSSFNNSLANVRSTLAAVPVATSISAIVTLRSQLSPSTLNLGQITSSLASARSTVNSVELSSVRSQLDSMNSTISTAKGLADSLANRVNSFGDALVTYLNETLPANFALVSANRHRVPCVCDFVRSDSYIPLSDSLHAALCTVVERGARQPWPHERSLSTFGCS